MIRWSEDEFNKRFGKRVAKTKGNKYKNKKITYNGLKFDSRKEFNRYIELKKLANLGYIEDLQLQTPFILQESFKDNIGRTERAIKYLADFVYTKDGVKYVEYD